MIAVSRVTLLLVFSVFLSTLPSATGWAYDEENRTAHRTPSGFISPPGWMFDKPEHYEFLPLVSNTDVQRQHPAAWDGQDWDSSQWNDSWTPEVALQKFFRARIFTGQYLRGKNPVVELGPTFYKISDLDQRRALKLLAEHTAVFDHGFGAIELVDWSTHDIVGSYTPKGMFLN